VPGSPAFGTPASPQTRELRLNSLIDGSGAAVVVVLVEVVVVGAAVVVLVEVVVVGAEVVVDVVLVVDVLVVVEVEVVVVEVLVVDVDVVLVEVVEVVEVVQYPQSGRESKRIQLLAPASKSGGAVEISLTHQLLRF
jgi:hypothetical protein